MISTTHHSIGDAVEFSGIQRRLGVAKNSYKVYLISVEKDNFAVEEYPCTEFGLNDLDGCFSFYLDDQILFCAEKSIFCFNENKHRWAKLTSRMDVVRFGTRSVSLKEGTIIAGGCESDGKGIPELTDSCVLLIQKEGRLKTIRLGKLPMKVKYHTLTRVSDNSFVMCGGINIKGHEVNDAYLGTLMSRRAGVFWYVNWYKLPNMCEWRSNHFSMYTDNRFYVFGGGLKRTTKQHLTELNWKYCWFDMGLFSGTKAEVLSLRVDENNQVFSGKFQMIRDMGYDISYADLVLSPDEKYCVIAGGEIYANGEKKSEDTYLTMTTKNMVLRSLGETDFSGSCESLYTNNILKIFLSCNCLTPRTDD